MVTPKKVSQMGFAARLYEARLGQVVPVVSIALVVASVDSKGAIELVPLD